VILCAAIAYYPRFAKEPMDLYPDAARCLLENAPLQACQVMFTYPPAFAFVMIPFAPMPMWLRHVVWYAITVGATIAAYRIAEMLARRAVPNRFSDKELIWLRVLSVLFSIKFSLAVFENQAYDGFSLLFIMLGLAGLAAGRSGWGGAGLAFAAAIKATPLVFFPYLLLKREFLAAAVFALVFAATSFLPDVLFTPKGTAHGYFITWIREVAGASLGENVAAAKHAFWQGANLLNHSLRGMVSLVIDVNAEPVRHRIVLYAAYAIYCAVVGALLIATGRDRRFVAVDGSLLLMTMLMLSPMTSRSHYAVLVLPYTTLIAFWLHDRLTRRLGTAILAASFILATATSNDLVGTAVTDWAYGHSFLVLGVLVLLPYLAAMVVTAKSEEPRSGGTLRSPWPVAGSAAKAPPHAS
jgi:hypothetical protein